MESFGDDQGVNGDARLAHARDLAEFILASPVSYHAAEEGARRLAAVGFTRQEETEPWDATPGGHYLVRGGALCAWWVPEQVGPGSAFRIVGAHTDSPGFKLKPNPNSTAYGFAQVDVETYGGLLRNSWLNRELGIAGRVTTLDGEVHLLRTDALMVIPQLAIHLDRGANDGLTLDPQRHLRPVWALGQCDLFEVIARAAGVEPDRIAGTDLYAYDTQAPQIISNTFLASGRQDNLVSVHAAVVALCAAVISAGAAATHKKRRFRRGAATNAATNAQRPAQPTTGADMAVPLAHGDIAVFAAFDHEEVGSATTTGASGPLLEAVLRRTAQAFGADEDEYYRMLARSSCVSSDVGHSINPNYPEKHDPDHYPLLGRGPIIKVNAAQRYASDALGESLWLRACQAAGLPTQEFVSNNAVPCGSTIGPLTATRLGITTVDVGIPLLSMHSAREISGVYDSWALAEILKGYWTIA
ncbi:M18 family aminopeptidase [Actinobaculum sp. 352]|nr:MULTISPECIES: M18 family aminopeptidase [unclassified Actinobaculum]AWE43398.1 M18 family aminopeptidase [Actinobaculum sp. 313]RTE50408.1 M18 family aminopeptidase [Actinobaculum sp. 352]